MNKDRKTEKKMREMVSISLINCKVCGKKKN